MGVWWPLAPRWASRHHFCRQELILAIVFLQIKAFDPHCIPLMETTGDLTNTRWPMVGPNDFDREMVRNHSGLRVSSRGTWDTVSVWRNGQDLGSLFLIRQCLQLWEMEIEKWGCNGLDEELGDSMLVSAHMPCSIMKLTKFR